MIKLSEIDLGSALLSIFILIGFIATAFVFIRLTIIGINYIKINYSKEEGVKRGKWKTKTKAKVFKGIKKYTKICSLYINELLVNG